MDHDAFATLLHFAVAALAVLSLGALVARGALRERALALGPGRDLGLSRAEYVFGVAYVCGYVALMLTAGGIDDPLLASGIALMPLIAIGLMVGRAMNAEAGFRKLGLAPRHPWRDVGWAAAAVPVAVALAWTCGQAMVLLSKSLGWAVSESGHATLERLADDPSRAFIVQVVIAAVVLAPLLEEPLFRGLLQTSLMRLFHGRRWPALLIASALFSVTHAWVVPWQNLVPLFVLGLVFGYLYERTGSLLTPVLAHAGFNAINIAMVLGTT
ncbi:MAG: lysostaphin resistance A-like protein [Phycisphaeraceae bacterium]